MNKRITAEDIDRFTGWYIKAALWSTSGDVESLDETHDENGLSTEAREKAERDCFDFLETHGDNILAAHDAVRYGRWNRLSPDTFGDAGYDFWMTRNGHGVGFWDGDWPDESNPDDMDVYCNRVGEVDPYVGDDNLIYGF